MSRLSVAIGALLMLLLQAAPVLAQTTGTGAAAREPLSVVISGQGDIAVGRTLVLDGSQTKGLGEQTIYRWFREGFAQPISRSVEAVLTPEKAGTLKVRLVVRTMIDGAEVVAEAEKEITVFERKVVLVADPSIPADKLAVHAQAAADAGVFLSILQPEESAIPLTVEESLGNLFTEQAAAFARAEAIVVWTEGIKGLQAIMRAAEADPERWQGLGSQTIVLITDRGLTTLARTARGPFTVLQPGKIVVTRKEAINSLLTAENIDAFTAELEQRDTDFLVVDRETAALRPWNVLTWLVNFMLTHGVSSQTVILLLSLPVIAMILAVLKQVIGITTFGLYTPSIVALSFLALGWWVGLLFLTFIVITGYATRAGMKRWRLLYIPKVAIILTVVSLTLLILLGLGASYGIVIAPNTIFILLIMSTLAETFLNVKAEEGWVSAFFGICETVLAALLCVFIVQWAALQSLMLAYPELILFTIVINAILGRWTGLRLVEYFRFREVFKHLQEE